MPNYVGNKLTVHGPVGELERMRQSMGDGFNFSRILPVPFELLCHPATFFGPERKLPAYKLNLVEKYGHKDWHDWCCENWGTKWHAEVIDDWDPEVLEEAGEGTLSIVLRTAWSPPSPVIVKLSTYFPMLSFRLEASDPMMDWAIDRTIVDGEARDIDVSVDSSGMA